MGASPDRIVHDHIFARVRWLELVLGIGSEGVHYGCSLGRRWSPDVDDAGKRGAARGTLRRWLAVLGAALDVEEGAPMSALDAEFAVLTYAPPDGPFPGISPAAWWAGLPPQERAAFVTAIVDAGLGSTISA